MRDKKWTNDTIARIHEDYYVSGPPDKHKGPVMPDGYPAEKKRGSSGWACAAGHDHRWRLTAWLCERIRNV